MTPNAAMTFAEIGSVEPSTGRPTRLGTAVVLGGSVAGMLAARVLADHAEQVIVIERDSAPEDGVGRNGVPQGSQAHLLLPAAERQLERWFPGFAEDAVSAGATQAPSHRRSVFLDGMRRAEGAPVHLLSATRPLIEHKIRQRLDAVPNVRTVTAQVTGLTVDDTRVTAVQAIAGDVLTSYPADLVVDATGRGSRLGSWLEAAGRPKPALIRQVSGVNYATIFLRRQDGPAPYDTSLAIVSPRVGGDFGMAFFGAVENDRWILTMAGYGECRPGATVEDMLRRCREDLPAPFGQLADNEPVTDVTTYRIADSRRRDFLGTPHLPAGLIAVGDAVASFNPVYGQGISSATLHASCLSMFLHSGQPISEPARHFFDLQRVVVDAAWDLSTFADLARPSVTAPRPRGYRVTRWLSGRISAATLVDPVVSRRFEEVSYMLRHPSDLRTGDMLGRALRARRPKPGAAA
ncbi:FAD-dependent oxidoreductase [Micromonospora sp. NPDC050397]|uniref:FAD-dependent oxidoreductase n=1 Tax=Micromonospora sp. NPDC050397 TaxID=3364279 RepID=UPI00384FCDA9